MNDEQATLPNGSIKLEPADFVVDEIAAYEPSGEGHHLYVHFRKTGANTLYAVESIAAALSNQLEVPVQLAEAGYAGMKDRHAITTQTASFLLPVGIEPPAATDFALDDIEILSLAKHGNKLKTGHLQGNRFVIKVRDVPTDALAGVVLKVEQIRQVGVPNLFGSQRFGRAGDNAAFALRFMRGECKPPRNRRKQRLMFSALQSMLFNRVLRRRLAEGTLTTVLAGDLAKKHDSGGMFEVPHEEADLLDAKQRAEGLLLSATGPMYGAKMRWPTGEPETLEREVLAAELPDADILKRFKKLGSGTRRALRMLARELTCEHDGESVVTLRFVLDKGGYATTLLSQLFTVHDASIQDKRAPLSSPDHNM